MATVTGVMGGLSSFETIRTALTKDYSKTRSTRTMMVDAFCLYAAATAIVQFVYVLLVGTFPFNSFLSSFICHVGLFSLGISLRLQISSDEFKATSPERSYGDFAFCALVLFFVVFSFMG